MLRIRVTPVEVIPSWVALGNQGGQVRTIGNTILFSATDLMRFVGCAHATALDLAYMRGEPNRIATVPQMTDSVKIMLAGIKSRANGGEEALIDGLKETDPSFDGAAFEEFYAAQQRK